MMVKAKRKKIIQIADYGAPYSGNFISSLLCLQKAVAKELDLDSILVLPEGAKDRPWADLIQKRGLPLFFVNKDRNLLKRFQTLVDLAKRQQAILLHSHFVHFDLDSAFAARKLRVKSIWHMHSDLVGKYTAKQRIKDLVKMRIVFRRWVDRVVPVSDVVAEDVKLRGCPHSKVTTIFNGIDLTRIDILDEKTRTMLKKHYHIREGQRVFLMFGWDAKRKGVDVLAKAAKLLGEAGHPEILCLIVSGEKDKPLVSKMIGDNPWVRIIPPVENIAELYNLADCFVSASRFEAFSYAIAEAMATGLPVVSSDIPSLQFYKSAGEGYITFGNQDASDLANCIQRICKASSKKLGQFGELNRHFIEEHLTVDRWCKRMIHLYHSLLT